MGGRWLSRGSVSAAAVAVVMSGGCATYHGVVKPVTKFSVLSPELEQFSDETVETYLKAEAHPAFPCTLAVAKLVPGEGARYYGSQQDDRTPVVEMLHGEEAEAWRSLVGLRGAAGHEIINGVQLVSPLLVGGTTTLKRLRHAAAQVHAPLLLAYLSVGNEDEGYNDAAIAYWSIVGLFVVPGNTVGCYRVCQGLLIDTRSGFVLATAGGESQREENVLPGAVDIARRRTAEQTQTEAVDRLEAEVRKALLALTE